MLIPPRIDAPELLDQGMGSPADVAQNFDDLWRINRWLGGIRVLTQHLAPRLRQHPGSTTILDVAAGSAQITQALGAWGAKQGFSLQMLGLELATRHLSLAQAYRSESLHLVQADALRLPFADNSVDYVISSLFLHHLDPAQIQVFLREALRVARRSILMGDLIRDRLALAAFRLSQPVFARNFLTRHDGAVSIRRAYTPAELQTLAQQAGCLHAEVHVHPFWRMALVVDKSHV